MRIQTIHGISRADGVVSRRATRPKGHRRPFVLRNRNRIIANLESQYKGAFDEAHQAEDADRMSKLDFEFQRDQLLFEVLLDIRDALAGPPAAEETSGSLLDKAEKLRRLTRLR